MIAFTAEAAQHVEALRRHFEHRDRIEAIHALIATLEAASDRITSAPHSGLSAPRPYPALAKPGRLWVKAGRYWIAYSATEVPVIMGVFYDTADITRRATEP